MVAPIAIGCASQCAESERIAFGRGIAFDQAASSAFQGSSSRSGGAPCAMNTTGMVPVALAVVVVVIVPCLVRLQASTLAPNGTVIVAASQRRALRRSIEPIS